MTESRKRLGLGLAIGAPLLTAAICGLVILKALPSSSTPSPSTGPTGEAIERAIGILRLADYSSAESLEQAAQSADREAGAPLPESAVARARAARLRGDADRERAALEEALRLAPDRPDIQVHHLLLLADQWACGAIPRPEIEAPALAIRPTAAPAAPAPPGLAAESLKGRAADVSRLLIAAISGSDPGESFAAATRDGMEERLQFALGVAALRSGRLEASGAWLRAAAEKDAKATPRWRALALMGLKSGHAATVEHACRRWREADPKDPDAGLYEALSRAASAEWPGALEALESSVAAGPAHRTLRGWAAYLAGQPDRARADAEAMAATDPSARLLRGLLKLAAGDAEGALADAQGSDYATRCLKAEALAAASRPEEAIAAWKEAIQLDGARPAARLGLADFLATRDRLDEALAELEEMPDHPHARRRKVALLLKKGDHAEALRAAEQAVARFPGEARLRLELGRVRHARGDHYGELQAYAQAIELDPSSAEARKLYAECLKEITPK